MKLTYGNQTIDLLPFDKIPKKIILSISGGLDSASVFYLICKYFPEIDIYPTTARDIYAPFDADRAIDIVGYMKLTFPNSKIHDHHIYDLDDLDPVMLDRVRTGDLAHLNVGYNRDRGAVKGLTMSQRLIDYYAKIAGIESVKFCSNKSWFDLESYMDSDVLVVNGMTRNPSDAEMKKNNFYHLAERRRDHKPNKPIIEFWGVTYTPYANVDKKFVSAMFYTYNLMTDLFPITNSCVGTKTQTDYFTKVCNECFWCKEKYWAFNQYK